MTQFGLLDMVKNIINKPTLQNFPPLETLSTPPKSVATNYGATSNTKPPATPKTLRRTPDLDNLSTLLRGDVVIDDEGNKRYVVSVDVANQKLVLTGKNSDLTNYKKTWTYGPKLLKDKIENNGFEVVI